MQLTCFACALETGSGSEFLTPRNIYRHAGQVPACRITGLVRKKCEWVTLGEAE